MVEIIIIAGCLILNAIFSCIEMAFVTVSRPYIKQLAKKGSTSAMRLLVLKQNPERALSVLQIGITLVGAISAAVGGAGAEEYLGPKLMTAFNISSESAVIVSVAIVVLPLTYLSVVIGELVPKSLALKFPMRFAMMGVLVIQVLDRVFSPFVFLLEISTKFFTRIVFSRLKSETQVDLSKEIDLDPLSESHKQYIFNLIAIDKRTVKDIMVPWEEVVTIDISDHYFHVLDVIKKSRHTRLPVMKEGQVLGALHTKEFVSETEITRLDWTELIRPVLKVNHYQPILNAIKTMQNEKSHMAVVKRDQTPVGLITVEDIFEEVVGEIFDEEDNPRTLLSSNSKIRQMSIEGNRRK